MAEKWKVPRFATTLWFVAAGLTFVASGIGYSRGGEIRWWSAAMGVLFLTMGIVSLARGRGSTPSA